jgi:hypothetical protein
MKTEAQLDLESIGNVCNRSGDTVREIWSARGTRDQVKQFANESQRFEPYHCTHAHDCCGGYYRHYRPDVIRLARYVDDTWLIIDTLYQNV